MNLFGLICLAIFAVSLIAAIILSNLRDKRPKKLGFTKVKERKWLRKIQCWFLGHWWAEAPDGSGTKFCERGCGK